MIQEDKELLLKDLCGRLPYGVMVKDRNGIHKLMVGNTEFTDLFYSNKCNIKPYLRTMSSMTDEEVKEFYDVEFMDAKVGYIKPACNWHFTINGIDWLNKYHFDYRGLIEKGLAIKTTKENNPYEEHKQII